MTGQEYARQRALMGISARALAGWLHITSDTLRAWEKRSLPLAADQAERWERALAEAASGRRQMLSQQGITIGAIDPDQIMRAYITAGWITTKAVG